MFTPRFTLLIGLAIGSVWALAGIDGALIAAAMAALGLFIGLVATDPATRVMSSMLYGVGNDDPLTIGVVAGVLFGVAGLACLIPAWRITKTDPMEALRYQ